MLLGVVLAASVAHQAIKPIRIPPPPERFELGSPLPALPGVMLDNYNDGMGLAQQYARAHNLQGRILWVDGTANLERVNTAPKIADLMDHVARAGFNTVVFDIKPISGQVLYQSRIAPKITEWRGQKLPADFDPLSHMTHEARLRGIQLLVSMNAFSEGHSLFKVGPGYEAPEHQSVLYDAVPVIVLNGHRAAASSNLNSGVGEDSLLHIVNDKSKLPAHKDGVFAVTVRSDGTIGDGFEEGGQGRDVPTIPTGGYVIAGRGEAGQFLRNYAFPGMRVEIDSEAHFVRTGEHPDQYPLMMNPNDPEVQERALQIISEVLNGYRVDGLLYDDRLRFAGLNADFSSISMQAFEKYLGHEVKWPDDVFRYTFSPTLRKGIRPGRYYDAWMLWRAMQMRNWMARVHNVVMRARPKVLLGIYGGSWYGDYPAFGSNYGSPNLDAGFWFLTPQYQKTGFASMLDLIITGCYYQTPTIFDAMTQGKPIGPTVESAGQLTNRVVDDQCWSYAGIQLSDFKGNPEGLAKVLQAACASTQGVMIFDLSHDIEPMWPVFAKAFRVPSHAPHAVKGALARVRNLRARYRATGVRERPVVISAGASGAGF
jgi:hypothetical protein